MRLPTRSDRRRPTRPTNLRRVAPLVGALALCGALAALLLPAGGSARPQVAPSNSGLPSISGSAVKGASLSATSGSWNGTAPITFAFSWLRCDSAGANCTAIGGATATTYLVVDADVGKRLRVQVTATNGDGTATALSAATDVVASGTKPVNVTEPAISGSPVEGSTLSSTSGSWTGSTPITYAFQWVRCPSGGGAADGSNCFFVPSATKSTYVLDDDDVGSRIRVRVTATNSAGSTTVASDATEVVAAKGPSGPPVNTAEPRISGTATQGQTLTATSGSWTGAQPISFTYRWVRCGADGGNASGSNCPAISGATRNTYQLTESDVGRRLRVQVTARNGAGSRTVASNPTGTVQASAPSGTIVLPNGERSIPVTSVPSSARLVVDQVQFSPNPVRSRGQAITVRIKVKDTRGYVVRDAIVFVRSTPKVTSGGDDRRTATDGWITYTLQPEADFPIRNSYSVQFYVKAYRSGDPVLGGVAGTRLVQVATAT
jgi:hypothetical protein